MQGHILEEWRIRDVEQKAERAASRLYELDTLRSNVDCLERTNREICTLIDGLRAALAATLDRVEALERTVEELTANVEVSSGAEAPASTDAGGRSEKVSKRLA